MFKAYCHFELWQRFSFSIKKALEAKSVWKCLQRSSFSMGKKYLYKHLRGVKMNFHQFNV